MNLLKPTTELRLPRRGSLPLDRWLAPVCTGVTGIVLAALLFFAWKEGRAKAAKVAKEKSISSTS